MGKRPFEVSARAAPREAGADVTLRETRSVFSSSLLRSPAGAYRRSQRVLKSLLARRPGSWCRRHSSRNEKRVSLIAPPITSGRLPTLAESVEVSARAAPREAGASSFFAKRAACGWCRVGSVGGGLSGGTPRRDDDHRLRVADGSAASRFRSPLARFAGRSTARRTASSDPMRWTCRRARVTAV
jgi:hypothetical protein